MPARALGALLAFVAAILFTASLASPKVWTDGPAIWDGHPTVDGHEISRKDAHVGIFGAVGCDDHGCQPLEIDAKVEVISFFELGITALAIGFAIVLGMTAIKMSDRRKAIAGVVIGLAILVAAGAGALIYFGPGLKTTQTVEIPFGPGAFVFGFGVLASLVSAALVLATHPEPWLLKSHLPPPVEVTRAPPVDVREILREQGDALRPAALGPEPVLGGRGHAAPPPLGGSLFEAAPQLKPLYELHGHTSPPPPQVVMPTRPPTPLPRASVKAISGLDTPPPEPPKPISPERPKPPSLAPLPKPAQVMAAVGRLTPFEGEKPNPNAAAAPAGDGNDDDPVETPLRPVRTSRSTLEHAVPPPPTAETLPPQGVRRERANRPDTDADDRLATALRETDAITAVEIDAEAKAKAKATADRESIPKLRSGDGLQRELEAKQMLESADDRIVEASLGSSPIVELDTAQQAVLDADKAARPSSETTDFTDENAPAERPSTETPVAAPPPQPPQPPQPPRQSQIPISTAPTSLPPPKVTTGLPSGPTPACPQCESPMAWVEEHLRFYCKSCRMYF